MMGSNDGWTQHRIPAFGGWNYNYPCGDDGAGGVDDDWSGFTPCFDFAYAMRTTTAAGPAAVQQKFTKRSSMPNARRMRVPAFGEWNHHGGDGNGNGNSTWPAVMTPFFDLATPQKAPKTTVTGRRRRGSGSGGGDGFGAAKLAAAADQAPQGHVQTRRSKVADSGAYATAAAAAAAARSCFTVAKPVDDDLYGVPPDLMLHGKPAPRKDGWLRILRLLGCCCCLSPS